MVRTEAMLPETLCSGDSYYSSHPRRIFQFAAMTETSLLSCAPTTLNQGSGFDLLCACATANPAPEQIARIVNQDWHVPEFDWQEFLQLAEHHGVLALLARNLTTYARDLPPEIVQSLQSAYAANLRRNMWFAAELLRITQHFDQKRLRALPYKGPVLAQSAYGDLGLRSFFDLDLLISPADFAPAKQVLAELGYHPSQELLPAVERLWLRTGYERSFDGAAGKHMVELQWNLLPYFYAIDQGPADFRFEGLWARSSRIALGAVESGADSKADIPCLSPEDSLLVLCIHAAKHLWTRLIWIADIAQTLRTPGIDLDSVVHRARTLGVARIAGVSFWLAEHLLGASIPTAAHELASSDSAVPVSGKECSARLAAAATYDFDSTQYFRQFLKLRERPSDRRRYLWRLLSTPGPGEVAAIGLPSALFPLYRVVRVGRLLKKLA